MHPKKLQKAYRKALKIGLTWTKPLIRMHPKKLQKAYRKALKIGLTWTKPLITGSSSSDGYSAPTKLKLNVQFI